MPDADIGGNGAVFVVLEAAYGTYLPPGTSGGVWMPILNENLHYTEDKYYSEQIRQEVSDSDVSPSYYHVEGDIEMEVDVNYLPYLLYASRHTVVKTGSGPYTYTVVPSKRGSTYPGGTAKGLSITPERNGVGFGYSGCVVNQWRFVIENGVLRLTASILGLAEAEPVALGTPAWIAPSLFGADAHEISVDASGTAPAFATATSEFNGFTGTINHNGAPQNRVRRARSASYISYGKTEFNVESELDFLDRSEYDDFVASTTKAYRFESIKGGVSFAAAPQGFQFVVRRAVYETYEVGLSGLADLVMANINLHGLVQVGAAPYTIVCKSPVSIT